MNPKCDQLQVDYRYALISFAKKKKIIEKRKKHTSDAIANVVAHINKKIETNRFSVEKK